MSSFEQVLFILCILYVMDDELTLVFRSNHVLDRLLEWERVHQRVIGPTLRIMMKSAITLYYQ